MKYNDLFLVAKKEYNDLFFNLGLEYLTIGTRFTKNKNLEKWNLRDLVAEVDYQYSTYKEYGHANYEQLHSSDSYERLQAMRECRLLKKFISKYDFAVSKLTCFEGHCSRIYG